MRSFKISQIDHQELVSNKTGEKFSFSAVLSQLVQFKDLFIHHEILPAGRRMSSPHRHSHREELVFVLEGHPTAHFEGKAHELSPGDFVGFSPGNSGFHFIENHTDSTAKILVVASNPKEDKVETSYDPNFDKIL